MSSSTISAIYIVVVLVVSVGIASYFVVPIITGHFRAERIAEHGTPATAQVLSLRDTGSRVNGQPVAAVELEVQPPGGAAFKATAQTVVTAINATSVQPGRRVTVRFDPANHSDVVILGIAP